MRTLVSRCPWHISVMILTVVGVALIVAAIVGIAQNAETMPLWSQVAIIALLGIALAVSVGMMPLKVKVSSKGVNVRLLCGLVRIPAEEIVSITHYPKGIKALRLFGCGRFFGNLGLFNSEYCGKHFSLVTDPSDVCVIVRKTKMPVAVSVEDAKVFATICEITEVN